MSNNLKFKAIELAVVKHQTLLNEYSELPAHIQEKRVKRSTIWEHQFLGVR